MAALSAMVAMKLDKVIFIIAGLDARKPSMLPEEARHRLSRSILEKFDPLFAYSPLALGTDLDGEANCWRLLALNSRRNIEIFYIAGADHLGRTTSRGEPDTIQKLEL